MQKFGNFYDQLIKRVSFKDESQYLDQDQHPVYLEDAS